MYVQFFEKAQPTQTEGDFVVEERQQKKKQQELEGLLRSTIIQDALSQQRTGTIIEYNPPKTRTTEAARHAKPPPSTKQLAGRAI
mmetsp:Transcript_12589/g.20553  ORF Transcript_12589/g.20553 Transcript_12589/m.20553 type:complete len:85 (-) Transcript_12589:390-644(-)